MAEEPIPPGFEFLANRFDKAIGELRGELHAFAEKSEQRFEVIETELRAFAERSEQRFEAIETALRDMSEQLVMHSRALNTLLSRRPDDEEWRESVERRLHALEQRGH